MAGTSAGRPGPQRQRTDDQCDPPGLARSTAQAGLVRLAGLRGRLEDCFGRAISAKSLDPRPSAPRTCGPAQSDSPAADMLGMTDSDRLRGGPTVRPTSTEVRHVNVPFSHPSEVYPQKDGRKVRSRDELPLTSGPAAPPCPAECTPQGVRAMLPRRHSATGPGLPSRSAS